MLLFTAVPKTEKKNVKIKGLINKSNEMKKQSPQMFLADSRTG